MSQKNSAHILPKNNRYKIPHNQRFEQRKIMKLYVNQGKARIAARL